jgi:hypothetical protein
VALVAAGTRDIDDDLLRFIGGRFEFALDRGHSAEDLGADVSKHGGTLGGDTVFRKDLEKSGEEEVDLLGGLEVVEFSEEVGGKIAGVGFLSVEAGMAEAEAAICVESRETAAFTLLGAMRAMR